MREASASIGAAFSDGVDAPLAGNGNERGRKRKRNVLVYCKTESKACAAVCAWLVEGRGLGVKEAIKVLEECKWITFALCLHI